MKNDNFSTRHAANGQTLSRNDNARQFDVVVDDDADDDDYDDDDDDVDETNRSGDNNDNDDGDSGDW